jgi:chaperonin GroES
MNYRPIGERILVEGIKETFESTAGLILPHTYGKQLRQGVVKRIGTGKANRKTGQRTHIVKEGDRVVFETFAGLPITLEDKELLLMTQSDLIAVIE